MNLPKAIVMRGISGMSVGFPLAAQYGCPYVVQRKNGEDCHSGPVVGAIPDGNGGTVVIIDDFVSSGETLVHMINAIRKGNENRGQRPWGGAILVLLYQDYDQDQGAALKLTLDAKCSGITRCVEIMGLDGPNGDAR